jgi:RNase adaptor protein for sRNA GlmZ degradation
LDGALFEVLSLRAKTGLHIEVGEYIKKTRGFKTQYEFVKKQASVPGTKVLYVGCTGGRHRSVFIAEILGNELGIAIEHRDLEKSHA